MRSKTNVVAQLGSVKESSSAKMQETFTQIDLVKEKGSGPKHLNIRGIAQKARVSISTVSRAMNHASYVSPLLAKRIQKVIETEGYYPSTDARALVSGRSRIFGLIIPEITNPFFPEVVSSFEEIAVQHGYEILLASTAHDPQLIQTSLRQMIGRRVEGVAILTFGTERTLQKYFRAQNVPLVFVDAELSLPGTSNIKIDYKHGIRQAVQHLAALRHGRIAFVSGPMQLRSAAARKHAFLQSLAEINIKAHETLFVESDHTIEGGILALTQLLRGPVRPTAVMCSNDLTALGVMRRSYELGIKIPQDLSIVGFDDIHLAQFVLPALTTVRLSQTELARLAFEVLWKKIQSNQSCSYGNESTVVTQLVLRESTYFAAA
jgi:LacI family transcriptional regulator